MKHTFYHRQFWQSAVVFTALMGVARVYAADAPTDAATPAPAPAAAAAPVAGGGSWYVFSPPKDGVVLPPAQREKLLIATKSFLERENAGLVSHLKSVDNPFYAKLAPPPDATNPATNAGLAAAAPVLQDGDKLQQVVDQLRPTGALIGGASRLIVFSSGDTLGMGASIQVTFPGDSGPTAIVLQNVSSDNFTLKLHDTVKSFPYAAKSSSASRPPPSTSPSKPPSRD